MQNNQIRFLLNALYTDSISLKDGTWVPDKESCETFINIVEDLAKVLGAELEDYYLREATE